MSPFFALPFRSPPSLRESVYMHIKRRLIENELRPGANIYVDRMANELDVSRTPVREALLQLEGEGLVTNEPHQGFKVADIRPCDVEDVYEVREILEAQAAYAVAPHMPDAALQWLQNELAQTYVAIEQREYQRCLALDLNLHALILNHCENAVLKQTGLQLAEHSLRIRLLTSTAPELCHAITTEHSTIVEALCTRSAERAHEAMRTHLANGRVRTRRRLEAMQGKAGNTRSS